MVAEVVSDFNVYYLIGQAIYQILQELFGIPSPMDIFLGLFSGRPTLAATDAIAHVLNTYTAPPIQFLSLGAGVLMQHSIPISSPDAAPIFGPYFVAAQQIENAVRFGDQSALHTNLTNQTLTVALNEAGNPGVSGTATLQGIQNAWNEFMGGVPQPGPLAYPAVKLLADTPRGDPAGRLTIGWAQRWLGDNLWRFPPGTPPPPPARPYPKPRPKPPAPPPPTGIVLITLNIPDGAVLKGIIHCQATYHAPQYPTAQIFWQLDGSDEIIGASIQLLTTAFADGGYLLRADLRGTGGISHGESGVWVTIENQPEPQPAPPPEDKPPSLHINIANGQTLHGIVALTGTVLGGPHPQAFLRWSVDDTPIAEVLAPAPTGSTPYSYSTNWNTNSLADGDHGLKCEWVLYNLTVLIFVSIDFTIDNAAPPPPAPKPASLIINLSENQTVSGIITLGATVQGGPYPNAFLKWSLDGTAIAEIVAQAPDGSTPYHYSVQWNTNSVGDGQHNMRVDWINEPSTTITFVIITIRIHNHVDGGGNGGGIGTLPDLGWSQIFKPCLEQPACSSLSPDGTGVIQGLANLALIADEWLRQFEHPAEDPCCRDVVNALHSITSVMTNMLVAVQNAVQVDVLIPGLHTIATAIQQLKVTVNLSGSGPLHVAVTLPPQAMLDLNCLCSELTRVADALTGSNEDFSDVAVTLEAMQRFMIDAEMTPPALAQIVTSA